MNALLLETNPLKWILCKVLGKFVPGVFWSPLSNLVYRDIPEPLLPGEDWVKLRTLLGGICGTDMAIITQKTHPATILRAFTSFPAILGHENVALVDQVGSKVKGWKPGMRVVVEPALSCLPRGISPVCSSCSQGCFSLCESIEGNRKMPAGTMLGLNSFTGGSWAPRFVAHHSQLHIVPDGISDEEAVLIDPIACSLHAVLRHRPLETEQVLVQGAGIIGLGIVMSLRALGHRNIITCCVRTQAQGEQLAEAGADQIIICRRNDRREKIFKEVAAAAGGKQVSSAFGNQIIIGGMDVVYDCVGSGRSLGDAMKFCKPRGTVVAVGTSQISMVDTTPLWFSELTLKGAYGRQLETVGREQIHTYDLVIRMMLEGKLDLSGILSRVYNAKDYKKAMKYLLRGRGSGVTKVAFRHSTNTNSSSLD